MANAVEIPINQAKEAAVELAELLEPGCVRIEIAGSIRRQKETVKDIELVAIPKMGAVRGQLYEGEVESLLNRLIDALIHANPQRIHFDQDTKRNGDRYKRLRFDGIGVDLFIVLPPAQWGVIFTIRTGPAIFGRLLVTHQSKRGYLPDDMRISEGQLWHNGVAVPVETERQFFEKIGVPWIEPRNRNEESLARWAKRLGAESRI